MPRVPPVLLALRPKQWTKNALVLAAPIFALGDRAQVVGLESFLQAAGATLVFCAVSSAVYIFNDLRDVELDRAHPAKKFRPIAAGEVSTAAAAAAAVVLLVLAAGGLALLPAGVALTVGGYLALQIGYTLVLKRVALVDVFVVAFGFVLRAFAGAAAARVTISPWLLLCTLLLALFLGLCKRRHEKVFVAAPAETRASLRQYDERLLDQLIAIIAAATIVGYALYTLSPETVAKFGTHRLGLTIPFVIFGLFRYLDLVYRQDLGDRPEQILLTDGPLLATIAAYGAAVLAILLTR